MQPVAAALAVQIDNADNDHFQRSCARKLKYATEREARRDAKTMHKKRHKLLWQFPHRQYSIEGSWAAARPKPRAGDWRYSGRVTILPRAPYNTGSMLTALCIWREARGCSYRAKRAIFCVLRNRCRMAPAQGFHSLLDQNILKPYAFSSFNAGDPNSEKYPEKADDAVWLDCMHATESGNPNDDVTNGAVFYFSDPVKEPPKAWGPVVITVVIDGLTFCAIDRNPVS